MVDLTPIRPAVGWCCRVAAWTLLFVALGVLAVAVLIPRTTGGTPYSVLSESMRPGLDPGDLIVVRPTAPEQIGIGNVITYQLESGEPMVATHRVVALTYRDGERLFQTRGDANDTTDEGWVRPAQIKGVVWYRAPYLGHLHSALSATQHQLGVNVVAGCLLTYAAMMFVGGRRDRLRVHLEDTS